MNELLYIRFWHFSLDSAEYVHFVLNPLLYRLFLDHDIIFCFRQHLNKFKKNLSKVLNTFENIMENGAFAPMEQMLDFPLCFWRQKALSWRIG